MAISLHNSASSIPSSSSSLASGALTAAIGEIATFTLAHEISGVLPTISSISDGTANVWHKRFATSITGANEPIFGAAEGLEVWWAYVANTLTAATITATLTGATDDAVVIVAGYQGFTGTAYQTNPWDANASLPKTAFSAGATSSSTASGISTTSTAGMLLAGVATCDWNLSPPRQGPPTGFTLVQGNTNTGGSNANAGILFDEAYSSAQSSVTITCTAPSTNHGWIFYVDALTDQNGGAAGPIGKINTVNQAVKRASYW